MIRRRLGAGAGPRLGRRSVQSHARGFQRHCSSCPFHRLFVTSLKRLKFFTGGRLTGSVADIWPSTADEPRWAGMKQVPNVEGTAGHFPHCWGGARRCLQHFSRTILSRDANGGVRRKEEPESRLLLFRLGIDSRELTSFPCPCRSRDWPGRSRSTGRGPAW